MEVCPFHTAHSTLNKVPAECEPSLTTNQGIVTIIITTEGILYSIVAALSVLISAGEIIYSKGYIKHYILILLPILFFFFFCFF